MTQPLVHHQPEYSSDSFFESSAFRRSDGGQLLFESEFLGRLRRELNWTLGEEAANGVLTRLGYSCGHGDLLKTGVQQALVKGLAILDSLTGDPHQEFVLEFSQSCEALEYLKFFGTYANGPQCCLLAGYLTGIISTHLGLPIYFLEEDCAAQNHERCRFIGKRRSAWNDSASLRLSFYEEENLHKDLVDVCEQLQLTKDRYQNLFEQSSVPMFIVNPESGAILDVNEAAATLTANDYDTLTHMNIFDLCAPSEHHQILDRMKELLQAGSITDTEISIVRKDNQTRTVVMAVKLLPFGGQRVIQAVMRDVTDLKHAEQKEKDLQNQLIRSERLSSIGHLAASVAHELKNPLGAIRNAIYYVKNALQNSPLLQTDPHLSEILKLAEGEVDGSVRIIGELLDFSRVVTIVPRKTSINDMVEELPNIITVPNNVELVMDLDPYLPSAIVDPDRLRQVFSNIMGNAIQAMPQGGKLTIQTRNELEAAGNAQDKNTFVLVSFQDTGVGIAPYHLTKIFEPLFTTKARGTGLGLAISNNIVEKHGGAIQVTSQQGKGTCFTVKLPLQPPPDKEESYGN